MRLDPRSGGAHRLRAVWALCLLALLCGVASCKKKRSKPRPWARALPKTTAGYPLPKTADITIKLSRGQLELDGKRLITLKDGRLRRTQLRDGIDGLFVPKLHQALRTRRAANATASRLAIHAQPAVPFRTLRAVLYTGMRSGFHRPWLVADGAGGGRTAIPLDLPGTPPGKGHGLRSSPPRTPAVAIGLRAGRVHITRWGRPDCPGGAQGSAQGSANLGCFAAGTGFSRKARKRLTKHLYEIYKRTARRDNPDRRRSSKNSLMVWAGLDTPVGHFVKLLDAAREAPGDRGSCTLSYAAETGRWTRKSALVAAAARKGCLFHQTTLVWSQPGHR